ncbi:MAG TPA: VanZ family protein [Cytophagaceae bacterium]|nr:VanZ family protein [Cytophagaceae bacterium]
MFKQILLYAKSIIGFVVILTLCWLPKSAVQEPKWFHFPNADKVVHFGLFFVWAFCLQLDLHKKINDAYRLLGLLMLIGFSTAALTELLQPIVSNRTEDLTDGLADILGSLTGGILFSFAIKKKLS